MRKFLLLSFLLLFLTGCNKEEAVPTKKDVIRQNWIDELVSENNLKLFYELEDGRKVYSSYEPARL